MTQEPEPNNEPETTPDLPTDDATDAWLAGQHHNMGLELAAVIDLDTGLRDIHLAGQHRDTGLDLASMLDLSTGLAAILPATSPHLARTAQFNTFTDLLNWLAATPTIRLAHRTRLQRLASDIEVLHHTTSTNDLDRAFARAFPRDLDLDHAHDLDLARVRALTLVRDRALAFDLDRALALAFDLDRALALARAHDLARVRDHVRDLARALDRARVRAHVRDHHLYLNRAHKLGIEICQLLCEAIVRLGVADLLRALNNPAAETTSQQIVPLVDTGEHARLQNLADDFVGADLHETDVAGLDLIGVQWSKTTHWPTTAVDWIVAASETLPNGNYVIRSANTNGGIAIAPDPVEV